MKGLNCWKFYRAKIITIIVRIDYLSLWHEIFYYIVFASDVWSFETQTFKKKINTKDANHFSHALLYSSILRIGKKLT